MRLDNPKTGDILRHPDGPEGGSWGNVRNRLHAGVEVTVVQDRQVTVRDIARLGGVSAATVSRALRDHPRISPATRARIKALARRVGYRPNPRARALLGGKVDSIGFIIGRCRQPFMSLNGFYGPTLGAVSTAVEEADYNLLVLTDRSAEGSDTVLPKMIGERYVAGVIVCEALDSALRRELEDFSFPYVQIDTSDRAPANCVYPEDEKAGLAAVRHLATLGHRDIAYVNTDLNIHICARTRLEGYLAGMAELGLKARPGYSVRPVEERLAGLFARKPYPSALFCFDDDIAIDALEFLWRRRIRVPDEVSIVGVNDAPPARRVVPQLTTVSTHAEEMGRAACEMLFQRIDTGRDVPSRGFAPELIVRESAAEASDALVTSRT